MARGFDELGLRNKEGVGWMGGEERGGEGKGREGMECVVTDDTGEWRWVEKGLSLGF